MITMTIVVCNEDKNNVIILNKWKQLLHNSVSSSGNQGSIRLLLLRWYTAAKRELNFIYKQERVNKTAGRPNNSYWRRACQTKGPEAWPPLLLLLMLRLQRKGCYAVAAAAAAAEAMNKTWKTRRPRGRPTGCVRTKRTDNAHRSAVAAGPVAAAAGDPGCG